MIPIARTEQLLIQEVGDELIIYDQINDSSHYLNALAVRVWELCNGRNTVDDIARVLKKEFDRAFDEDVDLRGLVWLILEELEQYRLIKEYIRKPKEVLGLPRRTVLKTAVLAGGFAVGSMFPAVKSIAVPDPGGARSTGGPAKPPCIALGGACTPGAQKAEDKCCQNARMNIACSSRTNRQPGESEFACEER